MNTKPPRKGQAIFSHYIALTCQKYLHIYREVKTYKSYFIEQAQRNFDVHYSSTFFLIMKSPQGINLKMSI